MAFRFREFKVYQDAVRAHIETVKLLSTFSRNYWYLADQIRRSSLSIVLNIAEGSSRQSDKDFNRFITLSLGSTDETVAALEVARELGLINQATFVEFEKSFGDISKQLGGFSKALKNSNIGSNG